jgi:hypothetical protein
MCFCIGVQKRFRYICETTSAVLADPSISFPSVFYSYSKNDVQIISASFRPALRFSLSLSFFFFFLMCVSPLGESESSPEKKGENKNAKMKAHTPDASDAERGGGETANAVVFVSCCGLLQTTQTRERKQKERKRAGNRGGRKDKHTNRRGTTRRVGVHPSPKFVRGEAVMEGKLQRRKKKRCVGLSRRAARGGSMHRDSLLAVLLIRRDVKSDGNNDKHKSREKKEKEFVEFDKTL